MILTMEQMGIEIEVQHHEVGTAGQAEIDMRFDTLLTMADKLMLYKYVVKSVARANGLYRHLHAEASLRRQRVRHARAQLAVERWRAAVRFRARLCRPLRHGALVHRRPAEARPGHPGLRCAHDQQLQAPGPRLRSAGQPGLLPAQPVGRLPHPAVLQEPEGKAGRVPLPGPVGNPYLAFSAILMAGLDGVLNKIEPPDPVDKDLYDLPPEELALVPQVPGLVARSPWPPWKPTTTSCRPAGVFTDDLIETWIEYKRDPRDRPGPPPPPPLGVLPLLRHLGSDLRLCRQWKWSKNGLETGTLLGHERDDARAGCRCMAAAGADGVHR